MQIKICRLLLISSRLTLVVMQISRQWDCFTNTKIPHFHVHNPKILVVGSAVVKTIVGDPIYVDLRNKKWFESIVSFILFLPFSMDYFRRTLMARTWHRIRNKFFFQRQILHKYVMISEYDSGYKERKNRFLEWHGKDLVLGSIQFKRRLYSNSYSI